MVSYYYLIAYKGIFSLECWTIYDVYVRIFRLTQEQTEKPVDQAYKYALDMPLYLVWWKDIDSMVRGAHI